MTAKDTVNQSEDAANAATLRNLRDIGETVSSTDEDIRGRMVKDKNGRDLGTIDGLLVDAGARKVRFMEVASGGFLGLGESKSLIPIEAITDITADEVHITHTREHVAEAPPLRPGVRDEGRRLFHGAVPLLRVHKCRRPTARKLSVRPAPQVSS